MSEQRFGLSPRVINEIHGILAQHPHVQRAIIYGSRAKGNYKPGSDIDLTLFGSELDYRLMLSIAGALDDSDIPYTVDLSIFAEIENPALRDHIERVGQVFYEREMHPA